MLVDLGSNWLCDFGQDIVPLWVSFVPICEMGVWSFSNLPDYHNQNMTLKTLICPGPPGQLQGCYRDTEMWPHGR